MSLQIVSPRTATKVLISKRGDKKDLWPSGFQSENKKIRITVQTIPATPGVDIEFSSSDTHDRSSYADPNNENDNHGTVRSGILRMVPGYSGSAVLSQATVRRNGFGVAQVDLDVDDGWAGDNYIVTAHINQPNKTVSTGNLVAWKRVYIEKDKMFKTGCDLSADFQRATGENPPHSVLSLGTNAGLFAVGNEIFVLDGDHCEPATVESRDLQNGTITVNKALANDYKAGYGSGGKGAAVGRPADGFYEADLSRLTNAFGWGWGDVEGTDGGAFVEFLSLPAGAGFVPFEESLSDQSQPNVVQYSQRWFAHKNAAADNYIHVIGTAWFDRSRPEVHGYSVAEWNCLEVCVQAITGFYPTDTGTAIADITAHEMGHQFYLEGVDQFHTSGIWCHMGQNTDYCLMGYQRNRTDQYTEFCLDHIIRGNHLGVRGCHDPVQSM